MKYIHILLAIFIGSSSAQAQTTINTDVVKITLPQGTKLVNKPRTVPKSDGTIDLVKGGEYKFKNIFLSIRPVKQKDGVFNQLEDISKLRKYRGQPQKGKVGEDLSIAVSPDLNAWAWEVKDDGYISYHFYVINNKKTSKLIGMIQFDPGDNAKAKTYLEQVLKGIIFK